MSATTCDADTIFRVFTITPGGTDIPTLLLDVRKKEIFKKYHIAQSFCVRLTSGGETIVDYSSAQYTSIKWGQDCWWGKRVIVYGDASLRKDHPVVDYLARRGKCASLAYYREGFDEFAKKFPFLCTASVKEQMGSLKYPSQIIPGLLFLGDWSHAEAVQRLDDIGVRSIITIHNHPENLKPPSRFKHTRFELPDVDTADISQFFNRAYEVIEEAAHKGHAVLVHCGAGVSRSATLCMMYLMRRQLMPASKAKAHVVERRSGVCPNDGFWRALCALEGGLGISTADRSDPTATTGFRGDDAPPITLSEDAAGAKVEANMISAAELAKRKAEEGGGGASPPGAKRHKGADGGASGTAAKGSYLITLAVSKPEGLVGHLEVGPMHFTQRCVFGRVPTCTVPLEHLSISRTHAHLTVDASGNAFVTDMQSGHGTKLDDTWIRPQVPRQLREGSVLRFGASTRAYKLVSVQPA